MARTRQRRIPLTIPTVSANFLKKLSAFLMCVYLFGQSIIQNGVLQTTTRTADELNALVSENHDAYMFSGLGSICMLIGVLGVPIISFLLVEGIQKTSSVKKYILTVLITAVATEIPYDFAVSGRFFNFSEQSFLCTITIALVMLWLMKVFQGKSGSAVLINILIIAGGCFWAYVFHCKFGAAFVLMTALLFVFRERRGVGIAFGVVISLIYISAPLGFIPVALYNGDRKILSKNSKYVYYALCPIITVCFALIANFVIHGVF